jgi:hypothetical protein
MTWGPNYLVMELVEREAPKDPQNLWPKSSLAGLADSKDMAIGVAHMHLAHVPRHVRRRPSYFESL